MFPWQNNTQYAKFLFFRSSPKILDFDKNRWDCCPISYDDGVKEFFFYLTPNSHPLDFDKNPLRPII